MLNLAKFDAIDKLFNLDNFVGEPVSPLVLHDHLKAPLVFTNALDTTIAIDVLLMNWS